MSNVLNLYCSDRMKQKLHREYEADHEKNRDLKVEFVFKGIIHPNEWDENMLREVNNYGGVTDEYLNFVELSLNNRFIGDGIFPVSKWHIGANPHRDFTDIKYEDYDIFYLGPIKNHFFHNIIEVFSRLWFFLDSENLKYKIAYTVQKGDEPQLEAYKDLFSGLGISLENLVEIKEPTQFRTVIVSEQSFELNGDYHKIYDELYKKLSVNVKSQGYEKVYLSKKENVHGFNNVTRFPHWEYVDKILKKNGFKILYPEKMSIFELISALKDCRILISQSGSSSFNAFFAPSKTNVCILNRSEHVHCYQINLYKIKNFSTTYVDVFYPNLPVAWDMGPFGLFFSEYFIQYLNDNGMEYNKKKIEELNKKLVGEMLPGWYEIYSFNVPPYNVLVDYLGFSARDLLKLLGDTEYKKRKKMPFFKRKYYKLRKKIKKITANVAVRFHG